MTFGIKVYGLWKNPYLKSEISNNVYCNAYTNEYSELNEIIFKDILKDELDIPDYDLNESNIIKEFKIVDNANNSKDIINNIINYYKWRKELFDKICFNVLNNKADNLLNMFNCDKFSLKYNIPARYNNFSIEDVNYTGGQVDAYLEITITK